MKKLSRFIMLLLLALSIGGAVFLATWDIPAPATDVERTIPDDRFPR